MPAGGATMTTTFDAGLPKMPSVKSDMKGVTLVKTFTCHIVDLPVKLICISDIYLSTDVET